MSIDIQRPKGAYNPGGEAFPVGAVFLSIVSTDPSTLLGYGTWSLIAAGRALVGVDTGDSDFDTPEKTSGAKTKSISAHADTAVADHAAHTHSVTSNVAVADHASHTHTYTEVPNHVHPQIGTTTATGNFAAHITDTSAGGTGGSPANQTTEAISTANNTSGVATGTTAGPSATLSHSVTNNAVTSGNPSATLSHSVTQPSDHSDVNVVQPSFALYVWKRTA